MTPAPHLIGLDWGTSSLRAYLMAGGGTVLEARSRPWGIRQLPEGGFEAALADICSDWPHLPLIAAGMVGSRGGWREVPYLQLPCGAAELGAALTCVPRNDGPDLHIVPGLHHAGAPDVMRGEETQIVGALALEPALAGDAVLVLPGTHSKWVALRDGKVVDFSTCMTGELFALLRTHSILSEGMQQQPGITSGEQAAFRHGVQAILGSGAAGLTSRLFAVRAMILGGQLSAAAAPGYLSGLLIGEEIRAALAAGRIHGATPIHLIGEASLCARYREAFACFDVPADAPIEGAAARGLWCIAERAGLVTAIAPTAVEDTPT